MKITNLGVNQINPYKRNQMQTEKTQNALKATADQLEISSAAKSMQTKSPIEVEQAERVAAIKADIEAGTYKVDAKQLATNILKYYQI
ncbi:MULTISPECIES: flagellar biosynthesis anti-sigma factor FlgM [unclassified Psychrobacillus]|uniref:flagellar biosynthesis anti-sigma factor FlgM n=1 Tax=unclassified Psychrobacillus TaxID=2636677 RepID=UPI0011A62623|nr:flagellar biosynthesis anti-sigma factor FlgM [Psychrobacillus sp. AK 1817]QEY20505.1 flagellar biosynthesis anti-sigma factor FlgM [Psychrobacillus sp. AK 1817]QGM31039.1 flagellar biosynthesis anti-sigma factor FlgM [Bacillus sp. N3536]